MNLDSAWWRLAGGGSREVQPAVVLAPQASLQDGAQLLVRRLVLVAQSFHLLHELLDFIWRTERKGRLSVLSVLLVNGPQCENNIDAATLE